MPHNMLLFVDVETTGFPHDWDVPPQQFEEWPYVVQLAWLIATPHGDFLKSEDTIIKPDGYEVPAASLKYHGITTETAEVAGIALEEALQRLASDLEWYDPVVVAHNLEFDSKVIDAAFYRTGRTGPMAERDSICTMKASADYCDLPGGKWPKLEELYTELFGEPLHGAHNALYDVMATARCYFQLAKESVFERQDTVDEVGFSTAPEMDMDRRDSPSTDLAKVTTTILAISTPQKMVVELDGKAVTNRYVQVLAESGNFVDTTRTKRNFWTTEVKVDALRKLAKHTDHEVGKLDAGDPSTWGTPNEGELAGIDASSIFEVLEVDIHPRQVFNADGEVAFEHNTATVLWQKGKREDRLADIQRSLERQYRSDANGTKAAVLAELPVAGAAE